VDIDSLKARLKKGEIAIKDGKLTKPEVEVTA